VDAFEQTARPFVKPIKWAQASSGLLRARTDCMVGSKFDSRIERVNGANDAPGAVDARAARRHGLKLTRRWAETGPDEFLKFS
jgi:hypothetical protein